MAVALSDSKRADLQRVLANAQAGNAPVINTPSNAAPQTTTTTNTKPLGQQIAEQANQASAYQAPTTNNSSNALLDEIKRKASLGIPLTTQNAGNQSIYDDYRSGMDAEIRRKAENGIPLTDTSNAYNMDLYNKILGSMNAGSSNSPGDNSGAPSPVVQQGPTGNSLIQQIYDSMYNSQSQKLKSLRDQQLAALAGQDDLAKQSAAAALNANDVSGARNANALREQMANLGILQSGDYISQQVAQNAAQGQNANAINMDMSNKLNQLLAQRNAINNNASADDLALLQSIQAQQAQAQLGQYNADRQFGLDEAGVTGNYNNNQTLAALLGMAGLTGNINGQRTMQGQTLDWSMNPDNPQNQGQILSNQGQAISNQLAKLQLADYPAQAKQQAQLIQQQLAAGQISNDTAKYQYEQLINPNSIVNQREKLALELDKLNLSSSTTKDALEVQKLKAQIADIGKTPAKSATETAMEQAKLNKLNAEIENIKAKTANVGKEMPGTPNYKDVPTFGEDVNYALTASDAYAKLSANSQKFIDKYGYDGYKELLRIAKGNKE